MAAAQLRRLQLPPDSAGKCHGENNAHLRMSAIGRRLLRTARQRDFGCRSGCRRDRCWRAGDLLDCGFGRSSRDGSGIELRFDRLLIVVFISVLRDGKHLGPEPMEQPAIACADSIAADDAASRAFAAVRADSAKRSSSSGFSAPNTSSASRLRLRTSLSLNPKAKQKTLPILQYPPRPA